VKVIVPFATGSGTDILGRLMADSFTRSMGSPFLVENRGGAGGIPGTEAAKNAAPDGYTLVMCTSGPFGINPAVYSKLPYDPLRDFEPIGNLGLTPQAIVVGAQQPWRTLRELATAAKAKPGEIAFASLGVGSTSHLTMEAFQGAAGVKLNHVPFKGSGEAHTQLMGGNVPLMSDTVPGVLANVRSGKLRALGVAIPKRSPHLPDVPTVAEQGYPGFESVGWIGLCTPAKTPAEIVDRLDAELKKMLADPATRERLNALAFEPVSASRAEFGAFIRSEIAKWTQVAKAAGAKAD
jgi:tripartite-type tricarboxylate transporter receptor subunit TctC